MRSYPIFDANIIPLIGWIIAVGNVKTLSAIIVSLDTNSLALVKVLGLVPKAEVKIISTIQM